MVQHADIWLTGTPIYNSFFSSALKNLFEYIDYKRTPGKVAGLTIVAAGQIGFIDVQTLLTQLMSYFRVVTNPKAAYVTLNDINADGTSVTGDASARLDEMVDHTVSLALRLASPASE